MRRKVELGASIALIAYVVGRFAIVGGTLKRYGVDPWIFLALDIGTVWPYVKGYSGLIRNFARNGSFLVSIGWGIVVIVSFALPYAYMYAVGGKDFPVIVHIVIASVILLLAAKAVWEITHKRSESETA